ncbi:MAG: hypothetical protein ACREJO_10800 [Phycisphaerales bacterium]
MAPTTPAPSPAKVCVVCKQDCSNRPRNKDEQGRYTCQDCAKKLATAGASRGGSASAAPPKAVVKATSSGGAPAVAVPAKQAAGRGSGGDDGIYRLAADPLPAYLFEEKAVELTAEQETCQNCGHVMRKSHVICIKCGHNKQNHKTLHTVLKRPEVLKEAKARRVTMGEVFNSAYCLGAIALVTIGLVIWMVGSSGDKGNNDFVIAYAVAGLYTLIAGVIIIVAAFMTSLVDGLLVLFLPVYSLYWALAKCESGFVKALYWSSVLVSIVSFVTGFRGFGDR